MSARPALLLALAALLAACSAAPRSVILFSGPRSVEALLAAYQAEPGKNITAFLLGRTEHTSQHLIFVRDREPPHEHATQDLTVTLLRGHGILWLSDRELPMREGDIAVVPAGAPHWFMNQGREPAAAFVVFAPASQ